MDSFREVKKLLGRDIRPSVVREAEAQNQYPKPAYLQPLVFQMKPRVEQSNLRETNSRVPSAASTTSSGSVSGRNTPLPHTPIPTPINLNPPKKTRNFILCPSLTSFALITCAMASSRIAALHGFDLLFVADFAIKDTLRCKLLTAYGPCPVEIPKAIILSSISDGSRQAIVHKGQMLTIEFSHGISCELGRYWSPKGKEHRYLIAAGFQRRGAKPNQMDTKVIKEDLEALLATMLREARQARCSDEWSWLI